MGRRSADVRLDLVPNPIDGARLAKPFAHQPGRPILRPVRGAFGGALGEGGDGDGPLKNIPRRTARGWLVRQLVTSNCRPFTLTKHPNQ